MSEHPSKLTFSIEESVWLNKGQEIEAIFGMSLEPEIMIEERDKQVFIKGGLRLIGKYQSTEEDEGEVYESTEGQLSFRQVGEVTREENGESKITHFLPVDITIPTSRIRNLEEVYVQVESFDYDLPERSCIQLTADISISGMTEPQEEIEEKAETKSEPILDATQTAFSFEAKKKADKEEKAEVAKKREMEEKPSLPLVNLESVQEEKKIVDELEREEEEESIEQEPIAHLSGLTEQKEEEPTLETAKQKEEATKPIISFERKKEEETSESIQMKAEEETEEQAEERNENQLKECLSESVPSEKEEDIPEPITLIQMKSKEETKKPSEERNENQLEEHLSESATFEKEEDIPEPMTFIQMESKEGMTERIEEEQSEALILEEEIQEERIEIEQKEEEKITIEGTALANEINESLDEATEGYEQLELSSTERENEEEQDTGAYLQEVEPIEETNEPFFEAREEEEIPAQTKINLSALNEDANGQLETDEEKTEETHREENALYLTKMMSKEEERFTTWRMCIIQENESLETIANRYEVSTSQLVRLNRLQQEHVEEGQILYIPVASESH